MPRCPATLLETASLPPAHLSHALMVVEIPLHAKRHIPYCCIWTKCLYGACVANGVDCRQHQERLHGKKGQ